MVKIYDKSRDIQIEREWVIRVEQGRSEKHRSYAMTAEVGFITVAWTATAHLAPEQGGDRQSLTPSVEGGYKIRVSFKTPFHGHLAIQYIVLDPLSPMGPSHSSGTVHHDAQEEDNDGESDSAPLFAITDRVAATVPIFYILRKLLRCPRAVLSWALQQENAPELLGAPEDHSAGYHVAGELETGADTTVTEDSRFADADESGSDTDFVEQSEVRRATQAPGDNFCYSGNASRHKVSPVSSRDVQSESGRSIAVGSSRPWSSIYSRDVLFEN